MKIFKSDVCKWSGEEALLVCQWLVPVRVVGSQSVGFIGWLEFKGRIIHCIELVCDSGCLVSLLVEQLARLVLSPYTYIHTNVCFINTQHFCCWTHTLCHWHFRCHCHVFLIPWHMWACARFLTRVPFWHRHLLRTSGHSRPMFSRSSWWKLHRPISRSFRLKTAAKIL